MKELILSISLTIFLVSLLKPCITSVNTINTIPAEARDDGVVYVAVVIHMNQLLEDINTIGIYGRNAYNVFYAESRLVHDIPGFKLTIDITGPTLHSLTATAPEIIENIRKGVGKGAIEILGVTYGQIPIQYLPWIDVVKHVEYENKLLKKLFNAIPRGVWQEDRQWTPDLIKLIHRLGFEYTLIDDNVFWRANSDLDKYEVFYPHVARDKDGNEVVVYHISEFMRYHFRRTEAVDDIIRYLEDVRNNIRYKAIPPIVVYGDDAEFGLNPDVIRALTEIPWIRFVTLSEYLNMYRDKLTVANYNVTGAYREYESMFGVDWYRWYSGSDAQILLATFNQARRYILELQELALDKDMEWAIDYAWTTLLLAEWQYGPFYNTWINSNLDWVIDTYIFSRTTIDWLQGNHGFKRYIFRGNKIYAYIGERSAIAYDAGSNSLRLYVNYSVGAVYSPLKVFETWDWWRYSEPGLVAIKDIVPIEITGLDHGFKLVFNNKGYIIFSIKSYGLHITSSKVKAVIRISPGGFNKYLYTYPFNIACIVRGDKLFVNDTLGSRVVVEGLHGDETIEYKYWYIKLFSSNVNYVVKVFYEERARSTYASTTFSYTTASAKTTSRGAITTPVTSSTIASEYVHKQFYVIILMVLLSVAVVIYILNRFKS